MKFRRYVGCIALCLACIMIGSGLSISWQSAAAETPTVIHTSPFTQAIASVRDSVVGVSNYQEVRYGSYGNGYGFGYGFGFGYGYSTPKEPETKEELASTGSGVVIGEGFVLTNFHVVEDASSLKVTVTDDQGQTTEYPAVLVAYDENLDAAIIHATGLDLPAVSLGDSDSLMVGDWAICIGNPLGFAKTTTAGIVSALNRGVESNTIDKYGRRATITNAMIQVDAAINSGNSGGGMFSVTGELMGIPTLKYSGSYFSSSTVEGIGMCIPINAVKPLINEVLSGKVTFTPAEPDEEQEKAEVESNVDTTMLGKPRMGITMRNLRTNSTARMEGYIPNGAYVVEVEKNSPAEKAGILANDIIVDVNDTVITSMEQISEIVQNSKAGDVLKIKLYRMDSEDQTQGEYIDTEVTLEIIDDTVTQ